MDWLFDSVIWELGTALGVLEGLLDGLFDSVCWELGTALVILDELLDELFNSVGWELGTALDVFDGLCRMGFFIRMAGIWERHFLFGMDFSMGCLIWLAGS